MFHSTLLSGKFGAVWSCLEHRTQDCWTFPCPWGGDLVTNTTHSCCSSCGQEYAKFHSAPLWEGVHAGRKQLLHLCLLVGGNEAGGSLPPFPSAQGLFPSECLAVWGFAWINSFML